ncbi:MAG: sce7726 family protein [Vulcanimicrobiaceae bacterium]|jgi:hypothetical protein
MIERTRRLSDRVIRALVHKELGAINVTAIDEARIFSSVVDVFAPVSLHAFEIKSEADDLRRLQRQALVAERTLPIVTLVTTETHLTHARELIGPWWGLWVAHQGANGIQLDQVRRATEHNQLSVTWVLGALHGPELRNIARANGLPTSGSLHEVVTRLIRRIGERECIRLGHTLLSTPARWSKTDNIWTRPILAAQGVALFPLPV